MASGSLAEEVRAVVVVGQVHDRTVPPPDCAARSLTIDADARGGDPVPIRQPQRRRVENNRTRRRRARGVAASVELTIAWAGEQKKADGK